MKFFATAEQMRRVDEYCINELGIPSICLMEMAAKSVYDEINLRFSKDKTILIVCGTGNNAADGLALGRLLNSNGYNVSVYLNRITSKSKEFNLQLNIIKNLGIKIIDDVLITFITGDYDIIVDALFGTGLNSDIKDDYKFIVNAINSSGKYIVSIDIPSGINATTGDIMGVAVNADMTVTFGADKIGMNIYPGKNNAGEILLKNIGFPKKVINEVVNTYYTYEDDDVVLKKRDNNTHKGNYGKVLIIAGNHEIFGALYFSAKASYKSGVGIVYTYTHENNKVAINTKLPEAINFTYSNFNEDDLKNLLNKSDVCLIGCGLGTNEISRNIFDYVCENYDKPIVIDADGINLIDNKNIDIISSKRNVILTPHINEMKRLCERLGLKTTLSNMDIAKCFYNTYKINLLLKDSISIFCENEQIYINCSGDSTLAKGGSGDILAGVIAGYIAQGIDIKTATKRAAYVHGKNGKNMGEIFSKSTVLPSEILNNWSNYE